MEEKKEYIVYCHTNLLDNKEYIGITKMHPAAKRWGKNGSQYKGCLYFYNAIQKYGWDNFSHEILFDNLTQQEAFDKEQELIKKYNTIDKNFGYNLLPGGQGPDKEAIQKMKESHKDKKLSEEHKKKISESLGQGVNNVNYGRKQTEKARKNNSLAKSGQNHPNWGKHLKEETKEKIKKGNSKKVIQYSLDGDFIKEWDNAKEAAKELGFGYSAINNCLRNIRHTSFGYIWKYKDEENNEKYQKNKEILETKGIRGFGK